MLCALLDCETADNISANMIDEHSERTNPYATFDGRTRRFEETNVAAKLMIEEEAALRLAKTQKLREMRLAASRVSQNERG